MKNNIINPSNPGLQTLDNNNWQKLLVLIMRKFSVTEIEITTDDISRLGAEYTVPFLITDFGKNEIKLVLKPNEAEAIEYVAKRSGKG